MHTHPLHTSPPHVTLPLLPAPGVRPQNVFPAEKLRENLARYLGGELRDTEPDLTCATWAQLHMPVHGTTVERALAILKDGAVHSYGELQIRKPESVANKMTLFTDTLDIELGLHRYVFLSLGRVAPVDMHPVYFVFPNTLLEQAGTCVALREIVHFGALVSKEAVSAHRSHDPSLTDARVTLQNARAATMFFDNVFSGDAFIAELFPRFLHKHYRNVTFFTSSVEYPGTKLEIQQLGDEVTIRNAWEGPQVTVPGSIDLARWAPKLLITDIRRGAQIESQLRAAGVPRDRIYRMDKELCTYQKLFRSIGDYHKPLNGSAYVNLALRDMALLRCNNRFDQDFPDAISGWMSRL